MTVLGDSGLDTPAGGVGTSPPRRDALPKVEYGLTMKDQPVLVGLHHTGRSHIPADVSRWEADKIALIIADTREQAQAAAELLHVEWEPLPVLRDIDEAVDGYRVHAGTAVAMRFVDALERAVASIAAHPRAGSPR